MAAAGMPFLAVETESWKDGIIMAIRMTWAMAAALVWASGAQAQQAADTKFNAIVKNAAYPVDQGPKVLIDEAHHNYHTAEGRYKGFAELLRKDGFRVEASGSAFSAEQLRKTDILVIANALHEKNLRVWTLPTPSAFNDAEIKAVTKWVKGGGKLLLIADHMPFPGAAEKLGKAFGFEFGNGYASGPKDGIFSKSKGLLREHAITTGRKKAESIDSVRTFTGQAFKAVDDVEPLMVFGEGHFMRYPKTANQFDENTRREDVNGWLHAGVRKFGKGRVAVFGEAAMFTAQTSGETRKPMGMNAPGAEQNQQFCLNVMRWLSGKLEPTAR